MNFKVQESISEGNLQSEAELYETSGARFYDHYPFFIPIIFMVVFVGGFYWWKKKK